MKYLYDTNIFIDYLAEEAAILPFLSEAFISKNEVIISGILPNHLHRFIEKSRFPSSYIETRFL